MSQLLKDNSNELLELKHHVPVAIRIVGFVLLFLSLYDLLLLNWRAVVLLFISAIMLLFNNRTQLDLKNKTMRISTFLGPLALGGWKPLPVIKYVSVFHSTMSMSYSSYYSLQNTSNKSKVYVINLVYGKNKRLTVSKKDDKGEGLKIAKEITTHLNVKLLDATERDKKWVDLENQNKTGI